MNIKRKQVLAALGRHCEHTFVIAMGVYIRVAEPIRPDLDAYGEPVRRDCPMPGCTRRTVRRDVA